MAALPWIAEVFGGLSALGCSPRQIAGWLGRAGVGAGDRVLDVGCGKGAAAVEVAARLGCRVVGVDAFGPFVESARELAARRGVAGLCRFEQGDARAVREVVGGRRFEVAMMVGLFELEEAAEVLRPRVRAGGVYLIDDCVSPGRVAPSEDAPLTRGEARMLLEERGDRVERETVWSAERVRRVEAGLSAEIRKRARVVWRREARARGPLEELLRRQRASAGDLVGVARPAMWLVRRRGSGLG